MPAGIDGSGRRRGRRSRARVRDLTTVEDLPQDPADAVSPEREASYKRLLDLPEEDEELNAVGVQALQDGIEDFAVGRTFTREAIARDCEDSSGETDGSRRETDSP